MRRCPKCKRTYNDEKLNYCLEDGERLIDAALGDESATAILPSSESPTLAYDASGSNAPSTHPATASTQSRKYVLAGVIGAVILAAAGAYLYFGRTTSARIESIAVMPFVNTSGNTDLEYLSDGITESLINSLSKLPKLSV